MASQAPSNMPLFYNNLIPLTSNEHGGWKSRMADKAPFAATTHAVPITIDEFVPAQRFFPIVFSTGENPIPLVLMGLNEGVNVFFDAEGGLVSECYVPAYVRRYPFMLARVQQNSDELSLCFDPTSELVGAFEEGIPLFEDGKPSEITNNVLKFCEDFELSAQRTQAFVKELKDANLLMEGEVSIQPPDSDKPFIYRGFQMVSEEKFRELRGDELRKMNQNGMLPLITAHLFSLAVMREIFGRQIAQGKAPVVAPPPLPEPVGAA